MSVQSDHLPHERMKGISRKQIRWQDLGKSQFAECEILLNILSKGPILNFFEHIQETAMIINCCHLFQMQAVVVISVRLCKPLS